MAWYEDLYNRQIYLDLYTAEDVKLAPREVDGLVQLLDLSPPLTILDVCCGYGRHALELARRGYSVTGIDLAPRQIEAARRHAAADNLDIRFMCGDAREMVFDRSFELVINLFTSFGFFPSDHEDQAMLARIFAATSPGGRLLLELWNRERILRNFEPEELEMRSNGIRVEKHWRFDAWNGRLDWENTVFFPDGGKETWSQSVRAYTMKELRGMLELSGFQVKKAYGDWDGAPYTLDSPRMIFIVRKE